MQIQGRKNLQQDVALLAEGVDRNCASEVIYEVVRCVALLAEGVDRNRIVVTIVPTIQWSPSSRRAWIEIRARSLTVAL